MLAAMGKNGRKAVTTGTNEGSLTAANSDNDGIEHATEICVWRATSKWITATEAKVDGGPMHL